MAFGRFLRRSLLLGTIALLVATTQPAHALAKSPEPSAAATTTPTVTTPPVVTPSPVASATMAPRARVPGAKPQSTPDPIKARIAAKAGSRLPILDHETTVPARLPARLRPAGAAVPSSPNVALPAVTTGGWPQFQFDAAHTGYNPSETAISAANVSQLTVAWQASAAGMGPVVADGLVFTSAGSTLNAYPLGCAASGWPYCTPQWTADTGSNPSSTPVVADGVVYIGSNSGKLSAYAVACGTGGGSCSPLWTTTLDLPIGSPVVANGVVYVTTYDGRVYAFPVGCSGAGGSCAPIWTANVDGSASLPAVSNGVVYVGSRNGTLSSFAVGCSSGGGSCSPLWTAKPSSSGASNLSAPVVADGVVYVSAYDGHLYAYAVGCSSGGRSCSPLWTATTGGHIDSPPAVANGVVYIGAEDNKLYAYAAGCNSGGRSCSPIWTATTGGWIYASPSVANGVVYAGSDDDKIYAFAVGCATGGGNCNPLWTVALDSRIETPVAIADGTLVVCAGRLYVLAPPPDHLVLSPARANVVAGFNQYYSAEGFVEGTDIGIVTAHATFAIGGGGSCTSTSWAVCTSSVSGDHVVTGTYGSATGTAILHVNVVLSGVVTDGSAFKPNVEVVAFDPVAGNIYADVFTDGNGQWSVALPPGTYSLYFFVGDRSRASGYLGASGFTFDPARAEAIVVANADLSNLNVVLPPPLHISGSVKGPGSSVLGGIKVFAYDANSFEEMGEATTAMDGTYSMAMAPGDYYVQFEDPGDAYAPGYWSQVGFTQDLMLADPVTVGYIDRIGVDIHMPVGLRIGGVVTDTASRPLGGMEADIFSDAGGLIAIVTTDGTGTYSALVTAGNYYMASSISARRTRPATGTAIAFTPDFMAMAAVTVPGDLDELDDPAVPRSTSGSPRVSMPLAAMPPLR